MVQNKTKANNDIHSLAHVPSPRLRATDINFILIISMPTVER